MSDTDQIDDPVDGSEAEAESSKSGWLLGGGVLLAAVLGGGYLFVNSGNTQWSDNAATDQADTGIEEQAIAEAPEEPEEEPALEARGVIAPKNESTIASKMTARITSMPYREGRSFRRGATLARFDCSTIQAQLNAARAATVAYRKTYETNVELDAYEAVGKNEVAVSRANLGRAQAEAKAIGAELSDCAVYAPFSGTVVEAIASKGEIAASGQPLLKIQSGGSLEADLIVPSNWLTWLKPGADFDFLIDETGATITGSVTRLGASVDPVSKTIRVAANISKGDAMVLPGMSGTATFAPQGGEESGEEPEASENEVQAKAAGPSEDQAGNVAPKKANGDGRKPS